MQSTPQPGQFASSQHLTEAVLHGLAQMDVKIRTHFLGLKQNPDTFAKKRMHKDVKLTNQCCVLSLYKEKTFFNVLLLSILHNLYVYLI